MEISSIDVYKVDLPFRFAFGHNLASRTYSSNLIVKVCLKNGICGWGEGIPRDYVTGEDIQSACEDLANYALRFQGWSLDSVEHTLIKLTHEFSSLGLAKKAKGAAWCALELAILDALGKAHRTSVAKLLGSVQSDKVRYGAVVPFCSHKKLMAVLFFYKFYGFQTIKIKVGKSLEEDIERLTLVRKILGQGAILRVDANCAWTANQAIQAMNSFRKLNVVSVEQPVPAQDIDGLKEVTESIPEQVIADESLCTIEQAKMLAQSHSCTGFNIRISKVGGLLATKEIAAIARKAGIKIHMGAQVGESGILSAAGRAFACIEDSLENCEGSNNFFLLKKDLTQENLNVGYGGWGRLSKNIGLGVTVCDTNLGLVEQMSRQRLQAGVK